MQTLNIDLDSLRMTNLLGLIESISIQGRNVGLRTDCSIDDGILFVTIEGDEPNACAYAAAIRSWVNEHES